MYNNIIQTKNKFKGDIEFDSAGSILIFFLLLKNNKSF